MNLADAGDEREIRALVGRIHASPVRAVVVVTGAGAQALAWLLGVPGASRTLLEASVPYARSALAELLGHDPPSAVSTRTAETIAAVAYGRALRLREGDAPVVGVGCTAAIATERPRRGEHRCAVATNDGRRVATYALTLVKGARDRAGEEVLVSRLVLYALAEACGVESSLPLPLHDGEHLLAEPGETAR